jgi:hypothetical protein
MYMHVCLAVYIHVCVSTYVYMHICTSYLHIYMYVFR